MCDTNLYRYQSDSIMPLSFVLFSYEICSKFSNAIRCRYFYRYHSSITSVLLAVRSFLLFNLYFVSRTIAVKDFSRNDKKSVGFSSRKHSFTSDPWQLSGENNIEETWALRCAQDAHILFQILKKFLPDRVATRCDPAGYYCVFTQILGRLIPGRTKHKW